MNIMKLTTAAVLLSSMANIAQSSENAVGYSLDFRQHQGEVRSAEMDGQTITFRAFEQIPYVRHPVEPQYQQINIYIPESYYQNKMIDGYSGDTAPIFFPNQVGGYMPAKAGQPGLDKRQGDTPNAILVALSKGYVVASAGARGRTSVTGKAPAAIVDLKAAVRYLKFNDQVMFGDANKIIANGTSAGGALSTLLGTTGDHQDYQADLKELGAALASDSIFAVSAYCPIINLEHADSAYEWQFNGVNEYKKIKMTQIDYRVERQLIEGVLNEQEQHLSTLLKPLFSDYLNQLNLKNEQGEWLQLDQMGNGSFKQYVIDYLLASAQQQLDQGQDLSQFHWLTVVEGKAVSVDFAAYANAMGRQKTPPAFDSIHLDSGENQLFGSATQDFRHFTDFSQQHSAIKGAVRAEYDVVKRMNPMNYVTHTGVSHHWRIRHGSADRDTSIAIPIIFATALRNQGKSVDFALPWQVTHRGDYDLNALFDWIKTISQTQ